MTMYELHDEFCEWMSARNDEDITKEKVLTFLREQGLEKLFDEEEYKGWEEDWWEV